MTSDGAVGLHKFYDPLFQISEHITPPVSEQTGPGKCYFDPQWENSIIFQHVRIPPDSQPTSGGGR